MSGSNTSFHSKIYNNFKEIDKYAHKEIVDFYATHEEDIQRLKFHEYFDLQIAYIDALFEIGAYDNLLKICDDTIEIVIQNNIKYYQGDDVFRKLLLRKAATHYNLLEYLKAEFILKELIKMDPKDFYSIRFYNKCQVQHPPSYVHYTRGIGLLFFLFTAMVICFEMSYFGFQQEPNAMAILIEVSRNVVFLMGWLILVVGDGIFRFNIFNKTRKFIEEIKMKKEKKEKEVSIFLNKS